MPSLQRNNVHMDSFATIREKNLPIWAANPLLSVKLSPLRWLMNLRMFGEGRKWTREQYAVTLPLLYTYNRANALELTEFFTALPEYVQTSDLEMEKAFVERFCKEEIAHMAAHIGVRQQKQNESNEQFLRSVLRDHKYMMRWRPDNTIPVEFVIRSFETRFVKPKMVEYVFDAFFEARINGTQVTFSSLVAMAEKADRHDGRMHSIENTGYLNDGLSVRVARVGHQTEEHKPMQESIESFVRQVVLDSAGSYEVRNQSSECQYFRVNTGSAGGTHRPNGAASA